MLCHKTQKKIDNGIKAIVGCSIMLSKKRPTNFMISISKLFSATYREIKPKTKLPKILLFLFAKIVIKLMLKDKSIRDAHQAKA